MMGGPLYEKGKAQRSDLWRFSLGCRNIDFRLAFVLLSGFCPPRIYSRLKLEAAVLFQYFASPFEFGIIYWRFYKLELVSKTIL